MGRGRAHAVIPQVKERIREELSQAKARCSISSLCFIFFAIIFSLEKVSISTLLFISVTCLFSFFWFFLLRHLPGDYLWRRRFNSLFDVSVVSYALYLSGEWGAIFYFLYLWIIVGNGMRFGPQSLMEVMAIGVVGFYIVLTQSDYWLNNMPAGIGLLIGLIILPSFYLVLIKRLHALNEKLNTELKKATFAATHDGMTNLLNREYFFQRVQEKILEAQRHKVKFAIMFIDLDGFKEINDTFGHHYGDKLLKSTAGKIRDAVRKSDIVARLGGDEFAVILYDVSNDQIDAFANRMLIEIEKNILTENKEIHITASVGISLYPDHGNLTDTLVMAADTAMYQSKKNGKNCVTIMRAAA